MALQAASAQLEVGAGSASGRIWAEDAGQPGAACLVRTCGELKSATAKTVRACTSYPPVLEPGIEEIGWLFGPLESARAYGGLTELGNADLTDTQIFGGVFCVLARPKDRYEVELTEIGKGFIGRLKLHSTYRDRTTRVNFENHYSSFEVQEILREPYSVRSFPGYEDIGVSFDKLETLVRNERPDWKAALESVKGIYLITDTETGRRYVGSAYGEQGIWSRWCSYVGSGHGGNVELRSLVTDPTLDYCRVNFRFALLEHRSSRTSNDVVIARETYWKRIRR